MKGVKTKPTVDAYKFTYVCTVIKNDIIFATRVLQNELYLIIMFQQCQL